MILLLLLTAVAAGFLLLERKWAAYALGSIQVRSDCDHYLAEPDQPVTWSATVDNYSRLPIPFVRLSQDFPHEAVYMGDQAWWNAHCRKKYLSWYTEYRLTLKGRRSLTRRIKIAFTKRGVYAVGNYQVGAGDLLGFREEKRYGNGRQVVIMPRHSNQKVALDAVGGFLGDVSVRRFILEDPILTTGFRDYTGREPMRAISWTRTAQSGVLQVKQYDYTAEQHVVVLLNVEGATEEELEECLRLSRSVCEKLEQSKIPYAFRTNGNLPGPMGKIQTLVEGLGEQHLNTILYGLGGADLTCFYSFRTLTRHTLKNRNSSDAYIVITPDDKGDVSACVQKLSNAVGAPVCVLKGCEGVRDQ